MTSCACFSTLQDLAPCILFVDDVDAIATKRETATKGMESRVVTQLANSMDGQLLLSSPGVRQHGRSIVG